MSNDPLFEGAADRNLPLINTFHKVGFQTAFAEAVMARKGQETRQLK